MKVNILKVIVPAALLGLLILPATAQTPDHPHSINGRFQEQHRRIHQGVESGQLTRREQYRLNERDSRIRTQEYRDRLSGGRFTPAEHRRIQRELNRSSHAIYRQKHDAQKR